ncbi:PP2C family protein-serine/threonine phosphatase [Candidatus Reidiella endopervernicosa]|nr:hypothetical protein [Candidatus Reidiella endopervernicosa]QKQ25700.1 hypothetical protein HUE57_04890 [Candidatus Reidiella endopervernicosa]
MRNTVTQCVGGSKSAQTPAFDSASLEPGDELLLCSDGLWNSLKESLLIKALEEEDLDQAADQLADQAELSSYPHSDNISLIAFRYLTNNSAEESEKPIVKPTPSQQGGSLDQALDEIERALDKYGSEMGDPK